MVLDDVDFSFELGVLIVLVVAVIGVGGYLGFNAVFGAVEDEPDIDKDPAKVDIRIDSESGKAYITASDMGSNGTLYIYSSIGEDGPKDSLAQAEPQELDSTGDEVVLYSSSMYSSSDDFEDPENIGEVMYYSRFTTIYVLTEDDEVVEKWDISELE